MRKIRTMKAKPLYEYKHLPDNVFEVFDGVFKMGDIVVWNHRKIREVDGLVGFYINTMLGSSTNKCYRRKWVKFI